MCQVTVVLLEVGKRDVEDHKSVQTRYLEWERTIGCSHPILNTSSFT